MKLSLPKNLLISWILNRVPTLISLLSILLLLNSCHVARYVYWNFADIHDYKKFPAYTVKKQGKTFLFKEKPEQTILQVPDEFNPSEKYKNTSEFLKDKKSVVLIIIRNDTIIYENYADGYSRESIVPSFSVVKSFVSGLVGIAIHEGYIKDVHQPVTDYLNNFRHKGFDKISLENLLNMRSGIKYDEGYYNPFGSMAKFYYGTNLSKYISKAKIKEAPDMEYDYLSINTQILGMALENATGRKLPEYLQEKIWEPLGMEADASWSMDSKKHGQTKAFCCLNGHPLDFARYGRLYLNMGNWNGRQVIPKEWIKQSISITNDSRDSQGYPYHYQWRVLEDGSYFAKGVLGQYIYVVPSRNLIFLRFGKKTAEVDWIRYFRDIIPQL